MAKERAKLFGDTSIDDIDLSTFAPKAVPAASLPTREQVKEVSQAVNFPSREAQRLTPEKMPKREPRIHRTGRNVQFQAKATQATIDRFYAICDQSDWRMGYTLERAVEALERELKKP
jgi:hypothetical protein